MQDLPRYFELNRFALIEITGAEAFAFLHRQITGDLNEIHSRGWMFSAWCQANGRVICTFIIFKHNQSLFLILPASMKGRVLRKLNMYVLRADVCLRDAVDDYSLLGIHGINSAKTEIFGTGARNGQLFANETCCVLDLWGLVPRCIMIVMRNDLTWYMDKIQSICKQGEDSGWALPDIAAGIPWITEATSEAFLPQMLNLDLIQGLSYEKGCYPGQEVIARLHYRGELKRKMFLGTGQGKTVPAAGDVLESADTGVKTGDVIDAARHPDGGFSLLAVVDINSVSAPLRLQGAPQTSIALQDLHYPGQPAA